MKALYYGDNLKVLRESIATESVDMIYLHPPFNSNVTDNVGNQGSSGRDRMRGPTAACSQEQKVRPEGAEHQWRKMPPRELSGDLVMGHTPQGVGARSRSRSISRSHRDQAAGQFFLHAVVAFDRDNLACKRPLRIIRLRLRSRRRPRVVPNKTSRKPARCFLD